MTHRREFLKTMAAMTAAISVPSTLYANTPNEDKLGEILPLRKLGKTGENITMLGVGGYHIGWTTERDAQEVIEAALEGGVRHCRQLNFINTSYSIGCIFDIKGTCVPLLLPETPSYLFFLKANTCWLDVLNDCNILIIIDINKIFIILFLHFAN